MHEFNLVPASYAARQARRRVHALVLLGAAGAVGLGVIAYVALNQWTDHLRGEVAALQQEQAVSTQQRNTITALTTRKGELEQQWRLLESLRSGMPAVEMMETVQDSLIDLEVWFLTWNLQRAGIVTEKETAPNQPGYFIIVKRKGADEDWRSGTHMTVAGQAWDHSELSEFAQRLLQRSTVRDVRVQRTARTTARNDDAQAVNFDLAIIFGEEPS